jgi:hypothetical protein
MTKKFSKVNKQRKTKRNRNKGKNKTRVLYRGGEEDKKFRLLRVYNSKDRESYIYFMPYNKVNKETIDSFAKFISDADYRDLEGDDHVEYEIDSTNLVSEQTANEMIKCDFGMFSKFEGIMKDPFHGDSIDDMTGEEIATILNDEYWENGITNLFEKQ